MKGDRIKNRIPIKDYLTFAAGSGIIVVFFVVLLWLTLSANGCF